MEAKNCIVMMLSNFCPFTMNASNSKSSRRLKPEKMKTRLRKTKKKASVRENRKLKIIHFKQMQWTQWAVRPFNQLSYWIYWMAKTNSTIKYFLLRTLMTWLVLLKPFSQKYSSTFTVIFRAEIWRSSSVTTSHGLKYHHSTHVMLRIYSV